MKACLPPLAVLAAILAFSVWNSGAMTADTVRWCTQLQQADALVQAEDWPGAVSALTDSYADWSGRQTYLRIVSQHDAVDGAESMYRRCLAFAAVREQSECRAELAGLCSQLRLLAEMERFTAKNVL